MKQKVLVALVAIWILSGPAAGDGHAGSRAPLGKILDQGGHKLTLQSVSLKEATLFKVNVYWVGMYSETANTPPDSILSSTQVKAFVFHFLRDVDSDKLKEAWMRDLTLACESGCRPVIAQGRVLARRLPDIRSGQEITYVLLADRVEVLIDGKILGTVIGASASPAVLATLLGPKAPPGLRKDLIGFVPGR